MAEPAPSLSEYTKVGAWLLAINGSAPKGYALYIPDLNVINYYDFRGKRYRILSNIQIPELDNLQNPKEFTFKK